MLLLICTILVSVMKDMYIVFACCNIYEPKLPTQHEMGLNSIEVCFVGKPG